MPKRVKRRKQFRGRMKGKALRGNTVTYGDFGLVAMEPCWITANQIEAARIVINRTMRRGGKVWVKIFPDKPITEKPAETRMGSGKGSPEYWVAVVKPGRVMFELAGAEEDLARRALQLAAYKLPIKCKVVTRAESRAILEDPNKNRDHDTLQGAVIQAVREENAAESITTEGEGVEN